MIKFCIKLNKNATETHEKLKQAYGEHALSRVKVFRWHKAFLDGRECGRQTSFWKTYNVKTDKNVAKVRALMMSDRCLTVRMISSELNLNHQTVHDQWIWHEENLCKAGSKNLINEQKENWRNVCLDLLECIENDENFFKRHNKWLIVDFQVWSHNLTTKFGVAHKQLATPEESKNEQIKNQIYANLFFWQWRCCL